MPDQLDDTRRQIRASLKELASAADEYARPEAASAALGGSPGE